MAATNQGTQEGTECLTKSESVSDKGPYTYTNPIRMASQAPARSPVPLSKEDGGLSTCQS